jgi:hypothetical protein
MGDLERAFLNRCLGEDIRDILIEGAVEADCPGAGFGNRDDPVRAIAFDRIKKRNPLAGGRIERGLRPMAAISR